MPFKDPEKRKSYHREWARKRYQADPEKIKKQKRTHSKKCDRCKKKYRGRINSRFCSKTCSVRWMWENGLGNQFPPGAIPNHTFPKGYKPWNWKGGKILSKGYVLILDHGHPDADKNGYVLEHRHVMAKELGRALHPWERVHHINAVKTDNRPENLRIVTSKVHYGEVTCPHCAKKFVIR